MQKTQPGKYVDGWGLILLVTKTSANWVFRFTSPAGKRREMGLGACHRGSAAQAGASLTAARDLAHRARELLRNGVDPIDAREGSKEAAQAAFEARKAAPFKRAISVASSWSPPQADIELFALAMADAAYRAVRAEAAAYQWTST